MRCTRPRIFTIYCWFNGAMSRFVLAIICIHSLPFHFSWLTYRIHVDSFKMNALIVGQTEKKKSGGNHGRKENESVAQHWNIFKWGLLICPNVCCFLWMSGLFRAFFVNDAHILVNLVCRSTDNECIKAHSLQRMRRTELKGDERTKKHREIASDSIRIKIMAQDEVDAKWN